MRSSLAWCAVAAALVLPAILAAQDTPPMPAPPPAAEAAKPVKKAVAKRPRKPTGPPARELFGAAKSPAPMAARAIGFYAKGCLAGGTALPIDGPAWQAMRLSRNRNWGHPDLVALVQKIAVEARQHDGWPGLLVGDISQPRGGPMLTGHASHQVGLDADIWLTPMPNRRLTEKEREELSATSMLAADRISVDPAIWTDAHVRLIKRAASKNEVERVLVHPAIKKALCEATASDKERTAWLSKVRPYWGHHYHFHVRIACPKGSTNCESQPDPPGEDGCGKELTHWLDLMKRPPKPVDPNAPVKPKPQITMDQLPGECRSVLASGVPPAPVAAKAVDPKQAVVKAGVQPAKPAAAKADVKKAAVPKKATVAKPEAK